MTVNRMSAFLGQLGWECNQARMLLDDFDRAEAYEGRVNLGNVMAGKPEGGGSVRG